MHQADVWRRPRHSLGRLQRSQGDPGLPLQVPLRLLQMPHVPEEQPELRLTKEVKLMNRCHKQILA